MLVAIIVIVSILSMKISGVIEAPWWFTVITCFVVFIIGMFIGGIVKVRFGVEEG